MRSLSPHSSHLSPSWLSSPLAFSLPLIPHSSFPLRNATSIHDLFLINLILIYLLIIHLLSSYLSRLFYLPTSFLTYLFLIIYLCSPYYPTWASVLPASLCHSVLVEHHDPNNGPGDLARLGEGQVKVAGVPGRVSVELGHGVSEGIEYDTNLLYLVYEPWVALCQGEGAKVPMRKGNSGGTA